MTTRRQHDHQDLPLSYKLSRVLECVNVSIQYIYSVSETIYYSKRQEKSLIVNMHACNILHDIDCMCQRIDVSSCYADKELTSSKDEDRFRQKYNSVIQNLHISNKSLYNSKQTHVNCVHYILVILAGKKQPVWHEPGTSRARAGHEPGTSRARDNTWEPRKRGKRRPRKS